MRGAAVGPVATPLSGRGRKRALKKHAPLRYGTFEVAELAGVNWRTVYRWLVAGKLPEPDRDDNDRRMWTPEAATVAVRLGAQARKRKRRPHA